MRRTFALPDLGEGLAEAEIVGWHVAVGDTVVEDQDLVDVQTDKAIVTVPSPFSGTLVERNGEPGDTLAVGAPLAAFEVAGAAAAGVPAPAREAPDAAAAAEPPGRTPEPRASRPLAAPSVRRRARELGVDLGTVAGTGPGGRILRTDLEAPRPPAAAPEAHRLPAPAPSTNGAARAGEEVPLRGLRGATARAMTAGWQQIPHIFDFRETDATELMRLRAALRVDAERAGDDALARAMTPLALIAKIAAVALRRHPELHGYVDTEREVIVRHSACHLGIAAATPDGLLTPVLRDADQRSVPEIARELRELVASARARRLRPEELRGATFLVNNLGALGTWYGSPLIPPGLGGNLGFGRVVERPVVKAGEIVVGQVLPLSISADHRLVDGDVLAAFAATVARLVETPALLAGELR